MDAFGEHNNERVKRQKVMKSWGEMKGSGKKDGKERLLK